MAEAAQHAARVALCEAQAWSSCTAGNRCDAAVVCRWRTHWRRPLSFTPRGTVIAHPDPLDHARHTSPTTSHESPANAGGNVLVSWQASTPRSTRPREAWRDYLLQGRVWLVVAVLHVLFMLVLWRQMRPPEMHEHAPVVQNNALEIRFFAQHRPAAVAPPPLAPPPRLQKPVVHREAAAPDAMQLQSPPPPSRVSSLHLFDAQGRVQLPEPATASTAKPGYVANLPQGDARVMHHDDPVKYKATRFEEYFPPPGENLGQSAVRHVVETVVHSTDVNLPHGVHLKCQTVLGIPIPNCIMPPAPPSAKDGDERLSMAPAASLDGAQHGPKPPSVEACIAMYRAGKPLSWGCPVDTPDRAVDAERRDRAVGAKRGH